MRSPRQVRQAGQSFVELSVSLSLAIPIVIGAGVIFRGAMDSMSSTAGKAKVGTTLQAGFDRLRADLALTDLGHLEIDSTHPHYDSMRMQVPVAITPSGITWGVELTNWKNHELDGTSLELEEGQAIVSLPGWWVRYRVAGRDLVREYVDTNDVVRGRPEVIVSGLARRDHLRGPGERCFRVWRTAPSEQPRLLSIAVSTCSTEDATDSEHGRGYVKCLKATVRVGAVD